MTISPTRLVLALFLAALAAGAAAQEGEAPAAPKFYIRPTAIFDEHLYEGSLAEPTSAFFDHARNELWVADTKNNLVGVFTPEGVPLFSFSSDQIREPSRLAVDGKGRVYVLDNDRSKIKVFDYKGRYLGPLDLPTAGPKPSFGALTFDDEGNLYVGENENCQVFVFGPDGKARQRFGECGADPGQFQAISGIAVDKERIVVVDAQVVAVQVFDKHGNLVKSWGKHDMGIQNFSLPASVGLDSRQHVVVIDTLRHEIKFFDLEGNFLERFGGLGRRPGQISFPTGMAVDGDRLFVVEKGNSRVQAFAEVEGDINLAQ
jgi:DNA-binding beta-propeller fold protein YncE